jgi:hypothetical protein
MVLIGLRRGMESVFQLRLKRIKMAEYLNRVQFENHSPARLGQRMCLPYRDPD